MLLRANATTRGREDWHADYKVLTGPQSRVYGTLFFKGNAVKLFDVTVKLNGTFDVNVGSGLKGKKISFRHEKEAA